jgi:hypothetical protein
MTKPEQLTLFNDNDEPPRSHDDNPPICPTCGERPQQRTKHGYFDRCRECRETAHFSMFVNYIVNARGHGSRKHPGMLLPGQRQGDGTPTPEQRSAALRITCTDFGRDYATTAQTLGLPLVSAERLAELDAVSEQSCTRPRHPRQ